MKLKIMLAMLVIAANEVTAAETEYPDPVDTTGGYSIDVPAGETYVYSGKITGSGQLTKTGAGTLKLSNPENDFGSAVTWALDIQDGYVEAAATGCLGTGWVNIGVDGVNGGMVFSAEGGVFPNRFKKVLKGGGFFNFKADTTLSGIVEGVQYRYVSADEGVTAVLKGDLTFGYNKNFILYNMKGKLVFEGKIVMADDSASSGITMYDRNVNVGGKIVYCNPGNTLRLFEIGKVVHICSNENVIAGATIRLKGNDDGHVDLNGYDQKISCFDENGAAIRASYTARGIVKSDAPATLTVTGTVAGARHDCNCQLDGQISFVLDANPAYTNRFMHRLNSMSGDIDVRSGVLDIGGNVTFASNLGHTSFPNVPKISVGSNGVFISNSSYNGASFPSVTNLTLASGGRFEIQDDCNGIHRNPFTSALQHLGLSADSSLTLPDNLCITVNTFSVNGILQHKGSYSSAECRAIKSGVIVALVGPPKGFIVLFN